MYMEGLNMMNDAKFQSVRVKEKFDAYPESIRPKLLFLRQLIFNIAARTEGLGNLEETLKWDEPSYITYETHSDSTLRIDWKKSTPDNYYMYFNCKTTLVVTFKKIYGNVFRYTGNRSLIFHKNDELPLLELSDCIVMALTYRIAKKRK